MNWQYLEMVHHMRMIVWEKGYSGDAWFRKEGLQVYIEEKSQETSADQVNLQGAAFLASGLKYTHAIYAYFRTHCYNEWTASSSPSREDLIRACDKVISILEKELGLES